MASVAYAMARHDLQKSVGAILGIAFAYILVGQNVCTTGHFLDQQTAFLDHAGADLWIVPPATRIFGLAGTFVSVATLHQARVTEGVDWAEPLLVGGTFVRLPTGGAHRMILVGTSAPRLRGGPFNMVVGSPDGLIKPNSVILDDSDREKLGGLNVGSALEIGSIRARAEGFTWGLSTLFGPYTFAELDFARKVLDIDSDRLSAVIIKVEPGIPIERVRKNLEARVPDAQVFTTEEFKHETRNFVLFEAGIIGILAMGLFIGFTVGLAIVTLSMLSSVQQNIREFGTLKAIGVTNADLRRAIMMQAVGYSLCGSLIGAVLLSQLAWGARSPHLIMIVYPWMLVVLVPAMTMISVCAALVAIRPVQKLEPASVFR